MELTGLHPREISPLFADEDHTGVGFLGEAERSAVPCPIALLDPFLAEWKESASAEEACPGLAEAKHDRAIMAGIMVAVSGSASNNSGGVFIAMSGLTLIAQMSCLQ